jgi:LuxR family maltose regulon positive regulatory protein
MNELRLDPLYAVHRQDLLDRLNQVLDFPLGLVVGSAGAGKTLLLSQWAAEHPEIDFAWISVEKVDDDPVRFARRLLRALSRLNPDIGGLSSLISMHGSGIGIAFLEALASELDEMPEVVLILDDLHHLANEKLLEDLAQLVRLLPDHAHLVLSSRMDLARVRGLARPDRGHVEIHQADLAFNESDAAALVERISGRRLRRESLAELLSSTEGWAAGLQLAAMTLSHHEDPEAFVAQFTGTDRTISDYMSGEILRFQPQPVVDLLLAVSVLDEMCADLARHLTGEPNAQLVLERLEQESMFLVPLDTRREWFRFHHLFRDLLRFRLRAQSPGIESELLTKAAAWHLEHGGLTRAIEYSLQAQDWEGALELINNHGREVFERGELGTLRRWIGQIPASLRAGRRDVDLLLGTLQVMVGQAAMGEDTLQRVVADPNSTKGEEICARGILASLAQWRPQPEASLLAAERALEALDGAEFDVIPNLMNLTYADSIETVALISGGLAHFLAGRLTVAREWLERAVSSAGVGYSVWRIHCLGTLGLIDAWMGFTVQAEDLAAEALALAKETGRMSHPSTANAYFARAFACLERGEPLRSSLSLHEGLMGADSNRRTPLMWIGHLGHALLQEATGEPTKAMATISTAVKTLATPPPPVVTERMLGLRSRMLRFDGRPGEARYLIAREQPRNSPVMFEDAAASLAMADQNAARKMVQSMDAPDATSQPLRAVERLLLSAWVLKAEGAPEAESVFEEALSVAERHSLIESFLRAGPAVLDFVSEPSSLHDGFRDAILNRMQMSKGITPHGAVVEMLTTREKEILLYLPSRLTNAQLAETCFVSVNAVKTHLARIYRKLGVESRDQAVERARNLGLLD